MIPVHSVLRYTTYERNPRNRSVSGKRILLLRSQVQCRYLRPLILATFSVLSILLQACSGYLGYGVVLWSDSNAESMKDLNNGQIIHISGESQVTHRYLFRHQENDRSIPINRIAFFRHLPHAKEYRDQFIRYRDWYAVNMNPHGLIMRARPDTNADQVYRLRPRQAIKVLDQASERLTLGNLEGRWYEVLTEDGVRGFTFDYHLRIEDRSKEGSEQVLKMAALEQNLDKFTITIDSLKGLWFEQKYAQHLRGGKGIDLRILMLPQLYGHGQFYLNPTESRIELHLTGSARRTLQLPYEAQQVNVDSVELVFNQGAIRAIFNTIDEISLYFHNQEGKESILELQKISPDELRLYQKNALARRKIALSRILQDGNRFSAPQTYGSILFEADGRFTWSNTDTLRSQGILQSYTNKGIVYFPYQLGTRLQDDYDQLITFAFRDNEGEEELTFLLKFSNAEPMGNGDSRSDGKSVLLRYVPPFMLDQTGTLNSDAFAEKINIQMEQEGKPLLPLDLF